MPNADGRYVYITRWLLADGSKKVSRGSSSRANAVGDANIFPMQADGATHSGWRYFWRVTASEASTEDGVDAVLTREYVEPAPMKKTPRVEQTIRRAERIASVHGQDFIGTEHLLMALAADRDGIAGQVLETLGVRTNVEEELESILNSPKYQGRDSPNPPSE